MKIEKAETVEGQESVNLLFNDNQEVENFNIYLSVTNVTSERWDDFISSRDSWSRRLRLNIAENKGNGRKDLLEAAKEFIEINI